MSRRIAQTDAEPPEPITTMNDLWKRKLAAYLHDPPSKALDIRTHGQRSDAAFHRAGFVDTEIGDYFARADHTAAAADRLPFPWWEPARLLCAFDGVRNTMLHPLGDSAGGPPRLPFHTEFPTAELGIEGEGAVQPALADDSLAGLEDDHERWRARFFAHWRLWARHAMEKDYRMALLPADTRIPDHSIWTHMQVTSALAGCAGVNSEEARLTPAFLKVQIGPVQDFIAAARSIRDLWSGSYLLSWLMAAGLKALSAEIGPDPVIFPNLLGQPLFDLHWREELWGKVSIGGKSVWDSLTHDDTALLTPNLPNVFLAVVPADRAADLGNRVEKAIRKEWGSIAAAVWRFCDEQVLPGGERTNLTANEGALTRGLRKQRFEAQIERFLSISWQATPWPPTLQEALALADGFEREMPIVKAHGCVQAVVDMAEKQMPKAHRDVRYFECERYPKGHPKAGWKDPSKLKDDAKLDNIGLGWAVMLALNGWQLDAVRQTRNFAAWAAGGWAAGTANNKDSLNGRDEAVAGGKVWQERCASDEKLKMRFKKDDWIGGVTLVKRLWDLAYLKPAWKLDAQRMPNTRGIAAHDPFAQDPKCNDDDQSKDVEDLPASEKYFAVLALDGDEIGKWVSGEKTPPFSSQLASYTDGSSNPAGAVEYFTRDSSPDGKGSLKDRFAGFLKSQRPLSPSYHLQFSQALTNFALFCARPIVEAFDGRLIYAGGDDVVALLPADTALECATALRMAFTGDPGLKGSLRQSAQTLRRRHEQEQEAARKENRTAAPTPHYQELAAEGRLLAVADTTRNGETVHHPGFLVRWDDCQKPTHERRFADDSGRPIPFLVPGPAADCSVGIAIAHFKSPLQDVVRAAQAAEKRAKKQLSRSAVAVTLFKRSGETIEWGAKWDGGLGLYRELGPALETDELSSKFPHRFAELLEAYVTDSTPLVAQAKTVQPIADFPAEDIIRREFAHCLSRQRGTRFPKDADLAESLCRRLNEALTTYLRSLPSPDPSHPSDSSTAIEHLLRSLIGLCQTVAFAHRTRSETTSDS